MSKIQSAAQEYTLADLVKIVGIKRRTVQIWAESGVLLANPITERKGTGTHRRFDRTELEVCRVLAALYPLRSSVGVVYQIAEAVRAFLITRDADELGGAFIAYNDKPVVYPRGADKLALINTGAVVIEWKLAPKPAT